MEQTAQPTADSRQQTADSKQQAADSGSRSGDVDFGLAVCCLLSAVC